MTMTRALTVAVVAVAAVASLSAFSADGRHADHHADHAVSRSTVIGYVESGDGPAALRRNLPALTVAAVDGVNINDAGTRVSSVDPDARAMLMATHRAGKSGELLVGNFSSRLGDFSPTAAHRLFSSARHRRTVIAALAGDVRRGWNGIHLDFESLRAADRAGLTTFTRELRAALPRRASLSMAVMASITVRGYRAMGYDLPALSRLLTRVVLMGYDQHGPTWTGAGPVGGLPWVRQTLRAMLASVPRGKAVLGVAGYGYTWPTHGTGTQLGDRAARRAAGSTAVWSATQGEWHGRLAKGGTVWWSDARSLQRRRTLARSLGVSGVAVWSLGLSDDLPRSG